MLNVRQKSGDFNSSKEEYWEVQETVTGPQQNFYKSNWFFIHLEELEQKLSKQFP